MAEIIKGRLIMSENSVLRKLDRKDAPYMLEWMHDDEINCNFQAPFAKADLDSVYVFIDNSFEDNNQHFAFVNENDEYMGTVSLKNISYKNKNAEYAIVTRKTAQGTGLAKKATEALLKYALEKLDLHKIYLNVLEGNKRAISFYEKLGFVYEGRATDAVNIQGEFKNLLWYGLINNK